METERLEKTNDEIEREMLAEAGITQVGDNEYGIDGKPYTVRFCGRTEDGFGLLWECDCPAAKFNPDKMCKHARLVADVSGRIADTLGYD